MNATPTSVSPPVAAARSTPAARVLPALAGYFVLQAVSRALVSASAELDEAEQIVLTQVWAWGYGGQPPLYTWLQAAVFSLLGTNILALSLVKAACLFGLFAFTWLSAREITGENDLARVAALSLFLLPQVAWEAQRDLTHSVLATALSAATLFLGLRLWRRQHALDYVWFGLAAALGVLSKYNFAVFLLALLVAAWTLPETRRAFLEARMLLAAGVFALVLAPHAHWMLTHGDALLRQSRKLHVAQTKGILAAYAAGTGTLLSAVVGFVAPLALICSVVLFKAPAARPEPPAAAGQAAKWLQRTLLLGLGICVLLIFAFRAQFKVRWMLPLLFAAPIATVWLARPRLAARKIRHLERLGLAVALVVLLILPAIPLSAALTNRPTRLNAPYAAFAAQLRADGIEPAVIAAESRLEGGNLKLLFPRSKVVVPEYREVPLPATGTWLVVWDATKRSKPPAGLIELVGKVQGANLGAMDPQYLQARSKYSDRHSMRLGYFVLPANP